MNDLQIFSNPEFGEIRTVVVNSEPMFCLTDVCKALEISNVGNVKNRLSEKGIRSVDTLTKGGTQALNYINEPNLYKTIFQSRKESAERFTDWVTGTVLPSIRQNGGYIAGQENMTDAELMAKAVLVAQNTIEKLKSSNAALLEDVERMKPKEIFADAVSASHTSILVGELAKLLKQNGVDTGQRRFFAWLRDNGYLIKSGSSKNMPTQKAMELGLFEIKEGSYINGAGVNITTKTTKVTGKGQQYFINKFLAA